MHQHIVQRLTERIGQRYFIILRRRIQAGCRQAVTDPPAFTLAGGTVACEVQEEDLIIEATLAKGGATAC
mgnify:CR=1 FL=1